jgi:hypothetical protein
MKSHRSESKRCRENLSLALKGRLIRNQVLEHLLALLWDGRVSSAVKHLARLTSEQIKNAAELAKLIGYSDRRPKPGSGSLVSDGPDRV